MTIEQTLTIPEETKHLTVDLPEPVPAGTATFRLEWAASPPQYEPRTPLAERTYKSLVDMVGSCKGLDTMDTYFERKRAEKEFEDRQYLRRHGEPI
jgi:hypothetical protein